MLTLTVPAEVTSRLEEALTRSGKHEIGGVMMAEHVGANAFVVREVTIHKRGTFASFIRRIEDAWSALTRFFNNTKRDYRRFNYIGEWHSHPSFEPIPSMPDHAAMAEIATDRDVGANFVVLMIVKLDLHGSMIGTAHTYLPNGICAQSNLVLQRG
jgi:[CysO sulfur-carrier protein]-S-L-cysteine hydrolase